MGSKTKQITHLSLLLVFLIGLAAVAVAEEGSGSDGGLGVSVTGSATTDTTVAGTSVTTSTTATVDGSTTTGNNGRTGTRMDDMRKRMQAREERFKETRDRLEDRMKNIRSQFADAKTRWLDIRAKIRANTSVDRKESFDAAKAFALRSNEHVQNYLERLKIRVDIQLEEEDAVTINAEIDAQVAVLADLSTKIEATTDTAGLKALLPEIRVAQHDAKELGKKVVGLLLVEVAQKRVEHVQGIHDRIELRAKVLKDDGIDTARVDAKLVEAQTHLDEATAAIATAQAIFGAEATADASSVDTSFKDGQAALREAHHHIGEALESLRGAVKALIELTPRVDTTTTATAETTTEVTA